MRRASIVWLFAAILASSVAPAAAQQGAQTPTRYVAGDPPLRASGKGAFTTVASDPPFTLDTLSIVRTSGGAAATVRLTKKRPGRVNIRISLTPPPAETQAVPRTLNQPSQSEVVVVPLGEVSPTWAISAQARAEGVIASTPQVPIGALTGDEAEGETRAWPVGRQVAGTPSAVACVPPKSSALDGFRAVDIEDKLVFTLHFAEPPARVATFGGRGTTAQTASVFLSENVGTAPVAAITFDVRRKVARYTDLTTDPPKGRGSLKIDVLGQNVLLKSVWRLGEDFEPFTATGFGTISPQSYLRASSTISGGRSCVVETATVRYDALNSKPRVKPSPVAPSGEGLPPYTGLALAFGGIAVIVTLALLGKRRAARL